MKFYNLFIFIIIIFLKTGNVLSENTIFSVNNIIIKSEKYRNHQEFLNQAYREGFYQLIERISLRKDYKKLKQTSLKDIKNLISHFQIQKISNQNQIQKSVNIYFDKDHLSHSINLIFQIFLPLRSRDDFQRHIYRRPLFLRDHHNIFFQKIALFL